MIDYTGSVRDHAPTLRREVLLSRTLPAPEWVADELHISRGTDIFYAERVDRLDQTAVAWDEVYIRHDHADALSPADLARVDFLEAWSDAQRFRPSACRQRVEAVRVYETDKRAGQRICDGNGFGHTTLFRSLSFICPAEERLPMTIPAT
jgi:DNA-binding GntR family transcriptional regulator